MDATHTDRSESTSDESRSSVKDQRLSESDSTMQVSIGLLRQINITAVLEAVKDTRGKFVKSGAFLLQLQGDYAGSLPNSRQKRVSVY